MAALVVGLAAALGLAGCRTGGKAAPVEPVGDEAPVAQTPATETVTGLSVGSWIRTRGAPDSVRSDIDGVIAPFAADYAKTPKRSYVDDAAYEAELYLRNRGYPFAETTYEIKDTGVATIRIEAGGRSTIGDVRVAVANGESPIAVEDLALYVNGPATGLFGTGPMLYISGRIARVPRRIREDLESLGHLDATAQIKGGSEPQPSGGSVDVTVLVEPGPRYQITGRTFEQGRTSEPLSDDVTERVEKAIDRLLDPGAISKARTTYRPRMEGTLRGAVADALATSGYPDARVEVTPSIDRDTATVQLAIRADPGPYVVLRDVQIEGELRTRASFLSSRMRIEQGDVYDSAKLRKSLRELYRTGLFSQVSARLEGDGEVRSIVVDVVERPAIELFAEPGFGSYELGRLTLGARDRNVFGRGIALSAEATLAVRAMRGYVGLTDPWFLRRELIGDLRLEFDQREEPSFTRQSRGVGAFVTHEWSRTTSTTLGYRFRRSQARDIEAVDADVLEVQSNVNVSGVIATQRYDNRDALFAPTSGIFAEASVELAVEGLGSELEFLRGRVTTAWFASPSEDDVIGLGLRAGVIAPAFDETTIPLQERFFAGGENSVRSFLESRLGPVDADGEALGGEAFGVLSAEWRSQLIGPFQSALFVDAGFVEAQAEDIFSLKNVRLGVGAGVRYLLPIGPLRIDAAFNPDRRTGEDEWVVHFAIGMPF